LKTPEPSVLVTMQDDPKMKKNLVMALLLAVSLLVSTAVLFAHHGVSAYDEEHPVTLKGTVTEFAWANPHVQVYFDIKDDKGKVVHWTAETLSPAKLVRSGWTKDSLKARDQISVTLSPLKGGLPVGFIRKIVFADGRELNAKDPPTP
jgi:hypothetical protein